MSAFFALLVTDTRHSIATNLDNYTGYKQRHAIKILSMDCPICANDYTVDIGPVESVCHHIICRQCAETLTKSGKGRCPMCRKTLTKGDFHNVNINISNSQVDNCTKHTTEPAVKVCINCMELLCETCASHHTFQHKVCPISDANEAIRSELTPMARAKMENIKLSSKKQRQLMTRDMEQQTQSIIAFGDQLKTMVDTFIGNYQQHAGNVQELNLQELYASLANSIVDFSEQRNHPASNTQDVNNNASSENNSESNVLVTNATDNSGTSNIPINNIDAANSFANPEPDDFIDDLVYGLSIDDDDFYTEYSEAEYEDSEDSDSDIE